MKTIFLTFMMVMTFSILHSNAQSASATACPPECCLKTGCTPEACAKLGFDIDKCKTMCASACKSSAENSPKCSSSEFKVSGLLLPALNSTKEENKISEIAKVEISQGIE